MIPHRTDSEESLFRDLCLYRSVKPTDTEEDGFIILDEEKNIKDEAYIEILERLKKRDTENELYERIQNEIAQITHSHKARKRVTECKRILKYYSFCNERIAIDTRNVYE